IGRDPDLLGEYFDGKIDQVKLYDTALSQQQIGERVRKLESSGAVLDLPFNSGGGDVAFESSLHGNDGTLKPNESVGPSLVDGVQGNARSFDSADDYVEVPDQGGLNMTDEFTVAAWLKPNNNGFFVVEEPTGSDPTNATQIRPDTLQWNNEVSYSTQSSVPNGEWSHVVITFDGDKKEARFYIDGALDVTRSTKYSSFRTDGGWPVLIGRRGFDMSSAYNGTIDSLKIYPYAISASKVKQLYRRGSSQIGKRTDAGRQPTDPGTADLVLDQSFDRVETCGQSGTLTCPSGMSGEIAVDESGAANHGELVNGPEKRSGADCTAGGCLQFRDNEYVNISNTDALSGGEDATKTIAAWAKVPDVTGVDMIVEKQWDSFVGDWGISVDDGELRYYSEEHGEDTNLRGGTIQNNTWHHLAATVNQPQNSTRLFVDGEQVAVNRSTKFFTNDTDGNVYIGARFYQNNNDVGYANATIDEVRVYDRVLSNNSIWHLYTQGRDRAGNNEKAGATARWPMDTARIDPGDGSDGALTVTAQDTIVNNYTRLSGDEPRGTRTLAVADASSFSAGDKVLIHQTQSNTGSAGQYEYRTVAATSTGQITLERGIRNRYSSGTFLNSPPGDGEAAQVVRVPQYTDVTIDGGSITAQEWGGSSGGIVAFRASGDVHFTNGGLINVTATGFRGGQCGRCQDDDDGGRGEGIGGWQKGGGGDLTDEVSLNNINGAGGNHVDDNDGGDPGAGGGHGASGETVPDSQSAYSSEGGDAVGTPQMHRVFFGGGGGGGADNDGGTPQSYGGDGGGAVLVQAQNISTADIYGQGEDGATDCGQSFSGMGGGGAGGAVRLTAYTLDTADLNVSGGLGANDDCDKSNGGETGGNGGHGRIRLGYTTHTGSAAADGVYTTTIDTDDAAGSHPGNLSGDPQWVDGKHGDAIEFDGTDDFLNVSKLGFSGDESITTTAWVKVDSGAGNTNNIFGFGNAGTTDEVYSIRTRGDGGWRFYFWGNDLDGSSENYYGEWTHVAAVYDAASSDRYIYVNGEQIAHDSPADPNFQDTMYKIGGFNDEYFDGAIDDVAVYPYALTQDQVQQVMNQGAGSLG
ncbi:MAG: LamG-like jellyroll fold domain-containing protein, partial [Candidatus Nanohaloarchaea archaeon]|nr:LamG-like jellyroll fold domain-containing protein [Candidatus Nanohaloarchaea archaeon]